MKTVTGTIFFMDGTKMTMTWPRQAGSDSSTIASKVKNALESDKLIAEVSGDLLVIPVRNIKYFQITPAPEMLPEGVVRGAQITG